MARFGLIGEKLGHSFSAEIHRAFGYDYELRELTPDEVPEFMKNPPFEGFNVTIPYKRTVMAYLDEIHPYALKIGAVNTIMRREGKLVGYNTDLEGMRYALKRFGVELRGKRVAILGSGGTSHTAKALAEYEGANEIVTVSRSGAYTYEALSRDADAIEVLINTTPVGMYPHGGESPLSLAGFSALEGVFDAIYNPMTTPLVAEARERGIKAGNGLAMLVAQGKLARDLFLSDTAPESEIERVLARLEGEKRNLVLIGMAGVGKTTIGRILAKRLHRPFFDSDEEVERSADMSIPEIFSKYGEEEFRRRERAAIVALTAEHGRVISTGGGGVLSKENVRAMRSNGVVVWIRRDPDLCAREGRPLSRGVERVRELLNERTPLYRAAADFITDNDESAAKCAEEIITKFQI